jgi:hypothetical protein
MLGELVQTTRSWHPLRRILAHMLQQPLPGWSPDLGGMPGSRYWDGRRWSIAPGAPSTKISGWHIVGIILAVATILVGGFRVLVGVAMNIQARNMPTTPATSSGFLPALPKPSQELPAIPAPVPSANLPWTPFTTPPPTVMSARNSSVGSVGVCRTDRRDHHQPGDAYAWHPSHALRGVRCARPDRQPVPR